MIEYVDVIIIGAGLSGVGAACRFRRDCPDKSVAILERRETSGGTWDIFRYPGVRCDTDMYTLGYDFEPFPGRKSITTAQTSFSTFAIPQKNTASTNGYDTAAA
jgi:monooxygenase